MSSRLAIIACLIGICVPILAWSGVGGASYTCQTNAKAESVLDRAIAVGGAHQGQTKQQIAQKNWEVFLHNLNDQQAEQDSKLLNLKLKDATQASKGAANTALLAGITAPSVTNPLDQTSPVNVPLSLLIAAIDPDQRPLTMTATNLPTGLTINGLEINGTPTTPGTYSTSLHVHKYPDQTVTTTVSFSWLVQP